MFPRTPNEHRYRKEELTDDLDTQQPELPLAYYPDAAWGSEPDDHPAPVPSQLAAAMQAVRDFLSVYLHRGRHRKPRPVAQTVQFGAAVAVLGVLTALFGNVAQVSTSRQKMLDAAVRAQPAPPRPTPVPLKPTPPSKQHDHDNPSTAPTTSAPKPSTTSTPAPTSSTPTTTKSSSSSSSTPTSTTLADGQIPQVPQGSDQIVTWINQAFAILQYHGYSASQLNASDVYKIIQHESGGNPNAENLSDSNAAKGTPSKGLMQTIDPTFNAWKLPGYGNIYSPVDNIIAGVRYSIGTYGSIANVPGVANLNSGGSYVGY
jgi:hypothetical protein